MGKFCGKDQALELVASQEPTKHNKTYTWESIVNQLRSVGWSSMWDLGCPGRMSILLFWLLQLKYIDDLGVSNFRREADVDGRFASFFFTLSVISILGKRSKRMWVDDWHVLLYACRWRWWWWWPCDGDEGWYSVGWPISLLDLLLQFPVWPWSNGSCRVILVKHSKAINKNKPPIFGGFIPPIKLVHLVMVDPIALPKILRSTEGTLITVNLDGFSVRAWELPRVISRWQHQAVKIVALVLNLSYMFFAIVTYAHIYIILYSLIYMIWSI